MKKVLAWAVALALVLSSFTMAFAADAPNSSQFKDADQIQYTEAVDVMVATGVINGYPDGTFGPAKTVKRSEMAKMISVMLNAGTDIGDQYADAVTFADSKGHWAAGYIAYCAAQHIIDGRSADVFDPEAEVTGTEVAKMALTSLGYDSKIQGYTGENWAANVLKDANKIELFDGLNSDFVPGDPCSREAAAQILFNTLQANMVEYENGTSVSVGDDVSVVVSSKIQDQTWPGADKEDYEPSKKDDNGDGVKQLYEEIFGGDLAKDNAESVKDDFGRPAHEWEYNGDDVGTYEDNADETFVTTEDFDSVEAAIADYNEDYVTTGATTYVNGVAEDTAIPAGTTVELTKSKKDVTYVVAYYYQLMQIDAVETEVSAKDAEDGVSAYVTVAGIAGAINDTDFPGYDAEAYVEDAYIAVCTDGAKVLDSYVPETKQGEITKFSKDSVFVDGTAYYMAGKDTTYVKGESAEKAAKAGDTVDLYLDKAGNALGTIVVKDNEAEVQYGVLTDVVVSAGGSITDVGDGFAPYIKRGSFTILDASGAEQTYTLSADAKDAIDETEKTDPDQEKAAIGEDILISAEFLMEDTDGVMVKYTLTEDGELDTMHSWSYDGELDETSMNSKGIMDGQLVNEDIVIFAYDTEEEAWTIFDYDDLSNAEEDSISGFYFINDDGIAALWATEGLVEAAEDTFGFFLSEEKFTVSKGAYYTVEMYVDGQKVTYDTIDTIGNDYEIEGSELGTPIVVSISDNKITAARTATFEVGEPSDTFVANTDGFAYADEFTPLVGAKTNKYVAFEKDQSDKEIWIGVAGAQAYKLSYDSEGELVFAPYTGNYKAEGAAMLLQIKAESKAWDVVIYMTPVDYAKYTAPVAPVEPLVEYVEVSPVGTENPANEGWYELDNDAYVLTADTAVEAGKTYYKKVEA